MTEQRYKAILAVIGDGRTVGEVARDWGVSPRKMHRWLARYEGDGLEGLNNRSHRPARCPHQTPAEVEAMVLDMRRSHAYRVGATRLALFLAPTWIDELLNVWPSRRYRSRPVANQSELADPPVTGSILRSISSSSCPYGRPYLWKTLISDSRRAAESNVRSQSFTDPTRKRKFSWTVGAKMRRELAEPAGKKTPSHRPQ